MRKRMIVLAILFGLIAAGAVWALGAGASRGGGIDAGQVEAVAAGLGARLAGLLAEPVDPATMVVSPAACGADDDGVVTVPPGATCTVTIARQDEGIRRTRLTLIAGRSLTATFDPATPPADDRPRPESGPLTLTDAAAEATIAVFPEGGTLRLADCSGTVPCRARLD